MQQGGEGQHPPLFLALTLFLHAKEYELGNGYVTPSNAEAGKFAGNFLPLPTL